jgi:hypothetical protein
MDIFISQKIKEDLLTDFEAPSSIFGRPEAAWLLWSLLILVIYGVFNDVLGISGCILLSDSQ